jgi:hypothetical protein
MLHSRNVGKDESGRKDLLSQSFATTPDSVGAVLNVGKSQLRVDASFKIARDCRQTSLPLPPALCTRRCVIRHEVFFLAETCVYSFN